MIQIRCIQFIGILRYYLTCPHSQQDVILSKSFVTSQIYNLPLIKKSIEGEFKLTQSRQIDNYLGEGEGNVTGIIKVSVLI